MSSAPVLRLTVMVFPPQQISHSFQGDTDEQQHVEFTKPRSFLLVIKNPEIVSLGQLANLIKDQWLELWPTEE